MKKKILVSILIVAALVTFATPASNAYALWWLLGCDRASIDPFNGVGGHWVTQQVTVYTSSGTEAYRHCDIGCGLTADGRWYYIIEQEVWVPNQGGSASGCFE